MSLDKYFSSSKIEPASDLADIDAKPVQPRRTIYAPAQYGKKQRDFQGSWYTGRDWLEFSREKKAAFCYCCRHFAASNVDKTFTLVGYSNWQHALEKNKGLNKHAISSGHLQAMVIWKERERRNDAEKRVSTLVNENQL